MGEDRDRSAARRYFLTVLVVIFAALSMVALFNIVIDPYAVWRLVSIPGVNAVKPSETLWGRMAKAETVRRLKPQAIILGSSRAMFSLDPQRPGWRDGRTPLYNLALPRSRMAELRAYFDLAVRVAPVKVAMLELEFYSGNANLQPVNEYDDARMGALGWSRDLPHLLFGDALGLSLQTIWLNQRAMRGERVLITRRLDGKRDFLYPENFDSQATEAGDEQGYLSQWLTPDPGSSFCLRNDKTGSDPLRELDGLLRTAESKSVKVIVVVGPVYGRRLEMIRQAGLWPVYEQWKRSVVRIAAAHRGSAGGSGPVVWDFTRFNALTTERFYPAHDPRGPSRYFWDSVHYKDVVGNMILDAVSSDAATAGQAPNGNGMTVTPANVDAQLESERRGLDQFEHEQPDAVREIAGFLLALRARQGRERLCSLT
ncbi:MAG TPA: hypothetical protein VG960_06840 [Caulobacteraceae bacterium]|nr:hypothetical protein [Caulobacteraceae bacterium]